MTSPPPPPAQGRRPWISPPMRTCLVISVSFTCVFTASLAVANLQSSLNKAQHLGVTALSVLYGFIIIFGPLAPMFIRSFGAKNALLLAWVIFAVFIAMNFYPTFYTLVPAAALKGVISGSMWTSQGLYLAPAGKAYAEMQGIDEHSGMSKLNGIFFMFYETSQVTGNLISSLVLSRGSYNSTSGGDDVIKHCGVEAGEWGGGGANTTSSSDDGDKPDVELVYILMAIFAGFNILGLILTAVALPRLELADKILNVSKWESLVEMGNMVRDSRMLLLIPLFMAQAMAIGVLLGDYTRDYITCGLGIQWLGYIMMSYGACCAVFAISINSLAGHVGRTPLFLLAIFADTGTLMAMLLWTPDGSEHRAFYFLIPVMAGVAEGILQSQFITLVAQVFSDNTPPAFATYNTSKAVSFTVTFALSTSVTLTSRLYIAISLYVLGLLGYVITEVREFKAIRHRNNNNNSTSLEDKGDDKGDVTKF